MRVLKIFFIFVSLAVISGCAPVISKQTMNTVDKNVKYEDIKNDPAAYTGKSVVLGGTIIKTENLEDRTIIEVMQEPLNRSLKPRGREESAGRFLVEFKGFKDPAIYTRGRDITVAGTVKGTERRAIDKIQYDFPVVEPTEHYLWPEREYRSEPSIGIGIGLGYTHID